eukprot:gnl/Spiro4/6903_TR3572_c0_g1_i1.p1 gnl/Spiro4/6903_TR3572_c0_g1~~gnl/Spiro4/6903_TR3572_c0_g1_i1.p1  ORF type:complete len:201 (+),score=14.32 gnl/Spiro4/6903_TR3572_c0_g1_i1:76-678(+)
MVLMHVARVVVAIAEGAITRPTITPAGKIITPFRCWPLDVDSYLHMNNASYFKVAELSRWRTHSQSGTLRWCMQRRLAFLIAEQSAQYYRPINPFQKFIVSTEHAVADDKWFMVSHEFLQHPSDVKPGTEPRTFAKIDVRAVLKEPSGRTVRPSELEASASGAAEWARTLGISSAGSRSSRDPKSDSRQMDTQSSQTGGN